MKSPNWSRSEHKPTQMPTSVFDGTFYSDSSDNAGGGEVSPGFAPPNGTAYGVQDEDRRPSVATVSSNGSKSSIAGKFQKKLHNIFGEEYTGLQDDSSRHKSEAGPMQADLSAGANGPKDRNNSVIDGRGAEGSSSPSRSLSRTPTAAQTPEVTPWEYQGAPVR